MTQTELYGQVVRKHSGRLHGYARGLCKRYGLSLDEAEDLVQHALVKALPRPLEGGEEGALRVLRKAIRHLVLDAVDHRSRWDMTHAPEDTTEGDWLGALDADRQPDMDVQRLAVAVELSDPKLWQNLLCHQETGRRQVVVALDVRWRGYTVAEVCVRDGRDPAGVRQDGLRGGTLIEGWCFSLAGQRPLNPSWPGTRQRLWERGHGAGERHQRPEEA